ncbi:MAG: BMC domain-containing protein, partial [Oscillospiraceae bacterium]
MSRAIGMIEYKTVSSGIAAADRMVKAANIELIEGQTVCPGKYIALFGGELSAIQTAIDI